MVADAAVDRAPTKVTTWVRRLAACFHGFYHDCPILADDVDPALTQARLWLVEATAHRPGHRARPPRGVARPRRCDRGRVARPRHRSTRSPSCSRRRPTIGADGRLSSRGLRPGRAGRELRHAAVRLRRGPPAGRAAGRPWRPGATAWPTPPRPSCAWPWPGWPTRRGCASTCPPAASSTWPWPPACPPTGWSSTATTSPTRSWPPPCRSGSAGSSSTPSTRSTGSSAWSPIRRLGGPRTPTGGPAAQGAGPDHPGGGGPHPRVRAHRAGGLEVRLRAGLGGGRPAPWRAWPRSSRGRRRVRRDPRPPRQPGLRPRARSPRPSRSWPASSPRSACPSWWSGAASAWPTSTARRRRPWPNGPRRCATACRQAGHRRRRPGHRRARPVDRGRGRRHPLPGGDGQGRARAPHLRVGRRRHERQPPPRALRQRLRGLPPPRGRRRPRPVPVRVVGKHCETGDVVVADGFVPADLAVGDVLATPVTGAYGHSMASNYNKVPRPAVVFVADGDGPDGGPPRDLRRPGPPRRSDRRRGRTVAGPGVRR